MRILEKITLLLIGFFVASCNTHVDIKYNYPNDTALSDAKGNLKDSLTFFYPALFIHDSQTIKVAIDTFELNWYSSALYCFKEPILYNYYLGHDIYRFLWLRSFHRPVVFTMNKDGDKVWLTTKMLNKEPVFFEMYTLENSPTGETVKSKEPCEKADRLADIVYNQTKELTVKEWTHFESILDSCSFWTKPYETIYQIDGAVWIIEGHLKNDYWFTNRENGKAGLYLIRLSELKEEIY